MSWVCLFVFFKQKTSYEVRMSDWSSDVCSSDLSQVREAQGALGIGTMADGAVVGEQASTHLHGLRVLSDFFHRHGSVLGEDRTVLLIGLSDLALPLLFLSPATLVAGQYAFPVTQAWIEHEVKDAEHQGADEQQEPPARQRVVASGRA